MNAKDTMRSSCSTPFNLSPVRICYPFSPCAILASYKEVCLFREEHALVTRSAKVWRKKIKKNGCLRHWRTTHWKVWVTKTTSIPFVTPFYWSQHKWVKQRAESRLSCSCAPRRRLKDVIWYTLFKEILIVQIVRWWFTCFTKKDQS